MFRSILALLFVLLAFSAKAATLYYESATTGGDLHLGVLVGSDQFIGVRFNVDTPTTVSAIGGTFVSLMPQQIFGAVVRLNSYSDFPDSTDLSTLDVLAGVTFSTDSTFSDRVVEIPPQDLEPGVYGVIFGSGLFGTVGTSYMPVASDNIGQPSYFWLDSQQNWRNGDLSPSRLTVYSESSVVPEPSSLLLMCGSGLLLFRRRRRS